MPELKLSCGTVHYSETGEGTPLVLLHANPGDGRDFDPIIPTLAQRYRVIALDWPGYGGSQMPENPESRGALFFYDMLREFVNVLQLPPAIFLGNSLGGNAAARLAIDSPDHVKALVLVAPGGFTPHNFITRTFCAWMGSRWAMSPRMWAGLYLRKKTPGVRAMLERASSEQTAPERLTLNRAVWRSFAEPRHDLRPVAASISVPTLLLFGKQDPAIPAGKDGRVAARLIPGASFFAMPCGHASFAELPDLFLQRLLPFLDSAAGG